MKVFSSRYQLSIYWTTDLSGSVLGDFTHTNLFRPNDNPLRLNEYSRSHCTDEKTEAQRSKMTHSQCTASKWQVRARPQTNNLLAVSRYSLVRL